MPRAPPGVAVALKPEKVCLQLLKRKYPIHLSLKFSLGRAGFSLCKLLKYLWHWSVVALSRIKTAPTWWLTATLWTTTTPATTRCQWHQPHRLGNLIFNYLFRFDMNYFFIFKKYSIPLKDFLMRSSAMYGQYLKCHFVYCFFKALIIFLKTHYPLTVLTLILEILNKLSSNM